MAQNSPDIAIITPVKNEEENLQRLFDSVTSQSITPKIWTIVDDSSSDNSKKIIKEFSSQYDWIDLATHNSSGYDIGENVSSVIRKGYDHASSEVDDVDYYMVLDADMDLNKRYLEMIAKTMGENPNLAVVSGGIYTEKDGEKRLEKRHKSQPAGGATLFKATYIEEINGFPLVPAWDSGIKAKAKIRGYDCLYLVSNDTVAVQARPTGGGESPWSNKYNRGQISYQLDLHTSVVLARSVKWSLSPVSLQGVVYLISFLIAHVSGVEKIDDKEIKNYYNDQKKKELRSRIAGLI